MKRPSYDSADTYSIRKNAASFTSLIVRKASNVMSMWTLLGDGFKPMLRTLRMYSLVPAMSSCTQTALFFGFWVSRLQTKIALSTADAKYIALSQALRDVIPLITLLKEVNTVFPVHVKTPTFVCQIHDHEDNQCASLWPRLRNLLLEQNTLH
jgi:hypothetical protein